MADQIEVALALVEKGGRWLVSRRAAGRVFADFWEFPGGKIRPGEHPNAAAVREALEETGLTVEAVESLPNIVTAHDGKNVILHPIRCSSLSGHAAPADPAIAEVRWVSIAELRQLPMPPANAQILDRLQSSRMH